MTTNIWKRQYSDPSNLDPFSGENHETYRSVTGFNISLFEGTVHTCGSKLQTLGMRYPFQSADRFRTETGGRFAFTSAVT